MAEKTEKKIHMPSKRQFLVLIPFAFCYAAFIVLGNWQKSAEYTNLQNVGRIFAYALAGYGVLLLLCLALSERGSLFSCPALLKRFPPGAARPGRWYVFLVFFLICLGSYLPYYLMYYPGWLNNDAVWQMEQILGLKAGSNHHPYFHTLLMRFFFSLGYRLSGTYTGAAAFYTFFQMAAVAAAFAFCLYVLYKRGTRLLWLGLAVVFYIALPLHGMLSICMGKDAFFVTALIFLAWTSHTYHLETGKSYGRLTGYFAAGLAVCLLRSNGILIFLGTAAVKIFCEWKGEGASAGEPSRRHRFPAKTSLCAGAVLLCYLLWQGPVLRAMQVEPPDIIEGLTMPTQHLLCAYVRGGSLTDGEVAMLERVVPLEQAEEYYNPYLFDVTKNYIRENGNQQAIAENRWDYLKLWVRAGIRNPMLYLEAEVRQTAGYWAYRVPHYQYLYGEYFMVDNPLGITGERKLFTYDQSLAMGNFLKRFEECFNRVWSLGLNTWVMLFGMAYLAWQKKNAMCYVPFIMLLASLLLAAPVYNEFRYAYGLFAAFPLLFGFTFGDWSGTDGAAGVIHGGEADKSAGEIYGTEEDGK